MSIEAPETTGNDAPARVKFGPGKTQEIPLAWAEFILATMFETQKSGGKPKSFGDLLQAAALEAR